MRTIKFRAWNKSKKVMQYNPPFGLSEHTDNYFNGNPTFEFQQFTGLLDKNGKEIYEGDIVRCSTKPWYQNSKGPLIQVVEIDRYDIDPFEGASSDWHTWSEEWEVIGNVWETHELLTQ